MEGLIPLFYRAVKKNRIRSQYSVLSPESAAASKSKTSSNSPSNYNIADFYVDPPASHVFPRSHPEAPYGGRTHRRFNSYGGSTDEDWRRSVGRSGHGEAPTQLVRFRSQRILSCLTGQSN